MKKTLLYLSAILMPGLLFAQSQEGTVEYQKQMQPAAIIELPYNQDIVAAAINDYLSKKGRAKGSEHKGFTVYRTAQPVPGDSTSGDLYFKTERKSRKEKDVTVVSLLLTGPESNSTSPGVQALKMEDAKAYLNELVPAVEAYNVEAGINDQNQALQKAEAKLKDIIEDRADLEKKKQNIEKKIEENKEDQKKQEAEVAAQKQRLAEWTRMRKS